MNSGPTNSTGALQSRDDEGDLGPGEPPVHRRHHHAGLHRAHQQLEIEVAVLAEIGDAVALLHAHRNQCVGDLVGLDVELGKAGDAALELVGGGVAAARRALAHHVGEIRQWLCGHVSPVGVLFLCRGVWRHPRAKTRWERGRPDWFNVVVLAKARTHSHKTQFGEDWSWPIFAKQHSVVMGPGFRQDDYGGSITPASPDPSRSAP